MTYFAPLHSARLHGARRSLRRSAESASDASRADGISREQAAMLRGKAKAYREAERLLASIEAGRKSSRLRRRAS